MTEAASPVPEGFRLRLYVAGSAPNSVAAVRNLSDTAAVLPALGR
jgi:hypothetical protein